MAVDGVIKEKKKKKRIKKEEEVENAQDGETTDTTQYHNASVQTTVKAECSEVNICDGKQHECEVPEKKKKKKIKEEKVDPNNRVTLCCDASAQTAVKTEQLEINSEAGQEKSDVPQKEKKKKKKTKKESELLQEEVMDISEAGEKMDKDCLEESRIKKVKKKREKQVEADVTEAGKKKKKKKKIEAVVKEEEVDVGHNGKIEKKKKKKKKRGNIEDEQTPELDDGAIKKKRKMMTETSVKTDVSREEKQTEKKKKKKEKVTNLKTKHDVECVKEEKVKIKKKKSAPPETEVDEVNVNTEAEKKSKKLKKRTERLEEGPHVNGTKGKTTCDVIAGVRSSDQKMKKNMKVEVDNVMKVMEEPVEKKRSKNDMNKFLEKTDVVFLSEKPGNQDEVSIDQARRLALQKEIDKESQPKSSLGQWGTAQFDSSDRQAKFLRLMGGFKKGSQPITESSGPANMALGKEGQQTLQQGLLGEFERAQSRHMDFRSKGTGLGFTAPSNKKFAIDVNVRNSIRFDD